MEELKLDRKQSENNQLEFKRAKDGFPKSFWETYSSFANSQGGTIYLGLTQLKDQTIVSSQLSDEEINLLKTELWNHLNNKEKVSANILSEDDITVLSYDSYPVLKVNVPQAEKEDKPVYINNNILTGSYRRNHEGDYRCSHSEIKAMLRDASDKTNDIQILDELGLDTLCQDTVDSYRNHFSSIHPNHVFLRGSNEQFLEYLGAIRIGKDEKYHPTKAGLLMFGYAYKTIYEFPEYFLDYQEHHRQDDDIRWTDRITSDSGSFSGNLYDFFIKVYNRLSDSVKTPFQMKGIERVDETDMHKAIREALCNAITNADFYTSGGLKVNVFSDRIEFTNPGLMKINLEKALKGGESDCRNKTIMKMFNLIGIGERAGSGIPFILKACKEARLKDPEWKQSFLPDQTRLTIFLTGNEEVLKEENEITLLSPRERYILSFLIIHPQSKAASIASALDVSVSTVKNELYKLLEKGLVVSKGTVKDKVYSINEEIQNN